MGRTAVPAEPQPWILVQPDDTVPKGERSTGFSVVSLPADAKLSPASSVSRSLAAFPPRARCVGAGHGWLALVGCDDLSVTLVNPVTGRKVSLPPLTRHPMVGGLRDDGRVLWRWWIDIWPNSGDLVPAETFVDTFVRKLVFSASPEQDDYFAVVVGDRKSYAMYARAGATAWETLRDDVHGKPVSLVHDIVHVEGGRFLAVTRCHGKVLELDLAAQRQVPKNDVNDGVKDVHNHYSPRVSLFAGTLASSESACSFGITNMHVENHLVLVAGELYQIWASWVGERLPKEQDSNNAVNRYHIEAVGIVKFDPELPTCWSSEAADLGDWAVLVGRNETAAVRAGDDDVPGLRGGCAYFIDGRLEEVFCAFDLRSGQAVETVRCDTLREAAQSRSTLAPPVWFLPSLKQTPHAHRQRPGVHWSSLPLLHGIILVLLVGLFVRASFAFWFFSNSS